MERRITHTLLASLLAFTICAAPFVDVKKAEAIAPAIPAVAGAAALAAELGITTEALMTGVLAITAAGTGICLLNSANGSGASLDDLQWRSLWNGSDVSDVSIDWNWDDAFKDYSIGANNVSWNDLSQAEKNMYGTPAAYVQAQNASLLEDYQLIQNDGNGGFEPTPEPDPEQDPDGNARWNKSRNTLTVLGVAGASVALDDAVGWLGETIGSGIHDLIFGTNEGFGYTYNASYDVGTTEPVTFISYPGFTYSSYSFNSNDWYAVSIYTADDVNKGIQNWMYPPAKDNPTINFTLYNQAYKYIYNDTSCVNLGVSTSGSKSYNGTRQTRIYVPRNSTSSSYTYYLNANYGGIYSFPNGQTYQNGAYSDPTLLTDVDYGQMTGTPDELATAVTNNNTWNTYINNATQDAPEGEKKAVVVPSNLDNIDYDDIVKDVQEEEITPIPDDEPVTPPNPNPNPNPDFDFDDSFTDRVNQLLSNPFDQLFPFCLIGDLRDFFFIIMGQPQMAQRVDTSDMMQIQSDTPISELNGVHTLTIPLNDWGITGVDNIEFDLDPIHEIGHYVKVVVTVALIMGIVMYSFSFFLKRGA